MNSSESAARRSVPASADDDRAPMLVARSARFVEGVRTAAATVSRDLVIVTDPVEVRRRWRAASLVLVGAECAPMVTGLGVPARVGVHLLASSADEAAAWSVPLQAPVVVLPQGSGLLTGLLADLGQQVGTARVITVVGASGGLGVSTLVAGLAQVAARTDEGTAVAAIEVAPHSGGLDLLMGAERQPGWRWPDLASAAGHVGELSGKLPRAAGVDLVSTGRVAGAGGGVGGGGGGPEPAAMVAITQSLTRSHDLVVIDAGRLGDVTSLPALTGRTLLLVGADVRSVVSARSVLAARAETDPGQAVSVVLRRGRDRRLRPDEVSRALGLPVVATVRDDRGVPQALELADLPARRPRSVFARDCRALLDALTATGKAEA